MATNEKNLIPLNKRTKEEQRVIQIMGGKASGEARRKKANLKKAINDILCGEYTDKSGRTITGEEAIAMTLFQIATDKKHNKVVEAYREMRRTMEADDEALASELERAEEILSGVQSVIS